jgi:hypothetical protein
MTMDGGPAKGIGGEIEQKPDEVRGRSSIEFPYMDQDAAFIVATAVHTVGGVSCDWNQLAAQLKLAATGGGFRLRAITAKVFGLLNYERGTVTLTELGIRAVDSKHARLARADSFLAVPLFKGVFDKLEGSTLPPVAAIERLMEQLGVAVKQKKIARQVFMRSAKQAGFFSIDADRLTRPPSSRAGQPPEQQKSEVKDIRDNGNDRRGNGGNDGGSGPPALHPFIEGLLRTLPTPESKWPTTGRTKWLQAAANIFDLIYAPNEETDRGEVKITVEKR